jgi:drug/metabolite transporter, DME family
VGELAYVMIAFAGLMWGIIGFFVKGLSEAGFDAMEIVTIRVGTAAVMIVIIGILKYRMYFKINLKDLPVFLGTGLMSIVFFNWCYFTAIEKMNIPVAVALLYTAPAFVIILSACFLKERVYRQKLIAVVCTIIGSAMVAGLSLNQNLSFPVSSIMIGLGAGLGYALYSIFGKIALRKYHPFTLTLYTFLTATVFLLPPFLLSGKPVTEFNGEVMMYALGLGLVPTVLAYFAYSWGLEKVESSRAAIIATIEPVAATFLGYFVYYERISLIQILGIALILASVTLVNLPKWGILQDKEKSTPL